MRLFLMVCSHLKYQRLHGLYLKITVISKRMCKVFFRRFYTEWLPFSGYEYAGLPDIEVYPVCEETPISGHSEVWIAISKEKENNSCTTYD